MNTPAKKLRMTVSPNELTNARLGCGTRLLSVPIGGTIYLLEYPLEVQEFKLGAYGMYNSGQTPYLSYGNQYYGARDSSDIKKFFYCKKKLISQMKKNAKESITSIAKVEKSK